MSVIEIKSSKKQRRLERQLLQNELNTGLELKKINPLTHNQDKTFDSFYRGKNLMLHGVPGSGKTFISMYLALDNILSNKTPHTKLIIIRSAQSSKNIGFLPGNEKQKLDLRILWDNGLLIESVLEDYIDKILIHPEEEKEKK